MTKDQLINSMKLQLQEQKALVKTYRRLVHEKDKQLLDLESLFVNHTIDKMVNERRSK